MPEDRSSKSLLTTLAFLILAPVVTAIINGRSLLDAHILVPSLIAVALLLVAYVPALQAAVQLRTTGKVEQLASDGRVWLLLFTALWVYFAGVSLMDRQVIIASKLRSEVAESTSTSSWPLPSKSDLSDLSDELRKYQPDLVQIIFDDPKNEPLALDFAKAMHQANWLMP